jgi:hypothetical protein
MQYGCSHNPKGGAAGQEMREVEMIRVRMSLQAIADLVQRTPVNLSSRHYLGAKINQQVFVSQNSRTFAQARAAERACSLTVSTPAKGFWGKHSQRRYQER